MQQDIIWSDIRRHLFDMFLENKSFIFNLVYTMFYFNFKSCILFTNYDLIISKECLYDSVFVNFLNYFLFHYISVVNALGRCKVAFIL